MVRFKNRYFTVEVVPENSNDPFKPKEYDIYNAVLGVTEQIHGEFGAASVKNGLDVKYFNEYTHIAVIRSRHGPHKLLGSSLPFLSRIGKRGVKLKNIYVGATMVKCFKHLQKYNQEKLNQAIKLCKTEQEKKALVEKFSKQTKD
uniref:Ribonuclease P/MRP protein subunit POP5 n=1 Tax=Eubosmina coregoni TaxID=186181 RepID=A0A4Y7LLT3_9CRUS|nr:EOG090X0GYO [Eubosmina coregoni]SVE70148.1 EOG090X0GYO [Eubosmina coregoni]